MSEKTDASKDLTTAGEIFEYLVKGSEIEYVWQVSPDMTLKEVADIVNNDESGIETDILIQKGKIAFVPTAQKYDQVEYLRITPHIFYKLTGKITLPNSI